MAKYKKMVIIMRDGSSCVSKFYSPSTLGEILGRSKVTVYSWIKHGVIPKPIYKDSKKRQQYSESQVRVMISAFIIANVSGVFEKQVFTEETIYGMGRITGV